MAELVAQDLAAEVLVAFRVVVEEVRAEDLENNMAVQLP